jgi:transposase
MANKDARSLSATAQETLRRRAVKAVKHGMTQTEAARVFGVSRQAIHGWLERDRQGGAGALKARRRGRPARSRLQPYQAASIVRSIVDRCPDQLRLPFALWTREAVRQLIGRRFGIGVSVWTVGRYLRHWGLTPQKPIRRAYEQDPAAVRRWLKQTYPQIRRCARREKAEIHWSDEMGLRSDHQAGRSYGLRGRTPVIPGTGQRFGCNMISSITNRGRLCFMVFKKRFTAGVFLVFLRRLLRQVKRKIFLIVDNHPSHRSRAVSRWLDQHQHRIRLFYLPTYSPQLNPDEMLNQDVKTNAVGRRRPSDQAEMIADVRSYLRSTQHQPAIVRNYFHAESVCYAAR